MNTLKRKRQTTSTSTAKRVALRKSILNQTNASLSLAKHVIDACARQSNFVFSPLSIHVLLGLVASGSNGPTRDQILDFLKSKSLDDLHTLFSERVSRVGLVLPFSGGGGGGVDSDPLEVTSMSHTACIEVNEEGTVAVAVSRMSLKTGCSRMMRKRLKFVADHPFLFLIREETTGLLLFIGHLLHPV